MAPIGGDVPGEDYRFVPPALGGERSQRPGVQARVAASAGDRGDQPARRRRRLGPLRLGTAQLGAREKLRVGRRLLGSPGLDRCGWRALRRREHRCLRWRRRSRCAHAGRLGGDPVPPGRPPVLRGRRRHRSAPGRSTAVVAAAPQPQCVRDDDLPAHAGDPGIIRVSLAGDAAWQRRGAPQPSLRLGAGVQVLMRHMPRAKD